MASKTKSRHSDPLSTTETGGRFEEAVAALLRLFGYNVERNLVIGGNQIDLKATVELPTHIDSLWVECKDHKSSLSIEDLRHFGGVLASAPEGVRGLFVTNQEITAPAKAYASSHPRLTAVTYRELERKVIDPAHYFNKLLRSYPESESANTYVDLRCLRGDKEEIEQAEAALSGELLRQDGSNLLVLLGEYGSGKSTLLTHFEYSLASSYLASSVGRIPIFVNLGDYTKALNIRQLITDLLVHRFGARTPRYDIFEELNRQGRLVLIFDGFDEMSARVDDVIVRENCNEIGRLCAGDARVVLSCRSSFFRNRDEELALFGVQRDTLRDTIEDLGGISTRLYRLLPFTWSQIERAVERYVEFQRQRGKKRLNSASVLQRIKSTYNLEELAQRPFLLNMILRSVPHIDTSLRTLSAGVLYDVYTSRWVRRDAEKGRTLETPQRRLFFAEELAHEMYTRSFRVLHWRDIPEWINRMLGVTDKNADYYDYDVRTCNFLSRNDEGLYYFAHRSFMEFFMARKLLARVCAEDYGFLSAYDVSEEIRQFMVDIGGNEIATRMLNVLQLVTLEKDMMNVESRQIAKNTLGLLRHLGFVRSIISTLTYIWQGNDRNLKAYLAHFLESAADHLHRDPSGGARLLLAAACLRLRGSSKGLDYHRVMKLWRIRGGIKRAIRWAYSTLPDEPSHKSAGTVIDSLLALEKGTPTVSTMEIAFALNIAEDEVAIIMRSRRGI